MNTVYLGLGSNINPRQNLPAALKRLAEAVKVEEVSSLWQTEAVGTKGPLFLNAAARIQTGFDFSTLKEEILCSIEAALGRVRLADKNAPRTIDLDILIFNQQIVDENIFRLDHLILPLAELAPELCDPSSGKILRDLAAEHCCSPSAINVGKLVY